MDRWTYTHFERQADRLTDIARQSVGPPVSQSVSLSVCQ